ncbi:Ig-like domain-containing protein [Azospirillum agricola]|uniref:Ig-like domain-containing protein n=1 Tax=Azospirillum agricola TaxID=1720247 RepID=UPI001178709C|nr:Ig-like domain-containing protein [Azospirillum agricola]
MSQEVGGATAFTQKTLAVTVAPAAGAVLAALLSAVPLNGVEDVGLDLGSTLLGLNLGSIASVSIGGIPSGATLSSGGLLNISANNIGVSLLSGLKLNMPANYSGDFQLTASVKLVGGLITLNKDIAVHVTPVADLPVLSVGATINGVEDQAIGLNISGSLLDIDGSESITGLVVSGLPVGATLNHGTPLGNGSYALTTADLVGLTMTPPANYAGTLALTVTATAKDGTAASASASGTLSVTVKPVADTPSLTVADVTVHQGHDPSLSIGAALLDTDGSEVLSVVVAGLSAGARLSAGLNNGDGSWTLTAAQLAGLRLTPPHDSTDDFTLTVTASAQVAGAAALEATGALHVSVLPDFGGGLSLTAGFAVAPSRRRSGCRRSAPRSSSARRSRSAQASTTATA